MKLSNVHITKDKRQELRANVLMPERMLWKWIKGKQNGYKFRRQHGIGKYIVDFYCPELKLIVEIDGSVHGEETVLQKDSERQKYLESWGYTVKRYTAQAVSSDLDNVLADLKFLCGELSSQKTATPPNLPFERGGSER